MVAMNTTTERKTKKAVVKVGTMGFDTGAINRARLADRTKYKYARELQKYLDTGAALTDRAALTAYGANLRSSRRSFFKAALRLITADFAQDLKANVTPQSLAKTQAALLRLESIRGSVEVHKNEGTKTHSWLSPKQVKEITALPTDDLEGWRDWVILSLLLGAGLRREELAVLTFEALKTQPMKRGRMRDVLEVRGKGDKRRVVPINALLAANVRRWQDILKAKPGDRIARALGRKKSLAKHMSAVALFQIVRKYGRLINVPNLAPHDLRRTFAQLGYEAGVPITQISVLLGHANVSTTQKYLNLALDLETTVSDFIPLSGD
jgi:site-specific recombinase XerD